MSEGFFNRWSRRKQEALQGHAPPARQSGAAAMPAGPGVDATSGAPPAPVPSPASAPESAPDAALPTLDDVQALTSDADFQPFMQPGVGAEVRNAAMKKLFADPHFNVMDGLDIYIDDYSRPDPLPAGMLRKMASAQFMRLVPDEAADHQPQDPDASAAPVQAPQLVAQSPDSSANAEPPHDHPDLQLQPDPAAANPQPGPGPR